MTIAHAERRKCCAWTTSYRCSEAAELIPVVLPILRMADGWDGRRAAVGTGGRDEPAGEHASMVTAGDMGRSGLMLVTGCWLIPAPLTRGIERLDSWR